MAKKKDKEEVVICPVGRFFQELNEAFEKDSVFFKHMNQSRIEFLKGLRALVDERIESFEKKGSAKGRKRATKIKVE